MKSLRANKATGQALTISLLMWIAHHCSLPDANNSIESSNSLVVERSKGGFGWGGYVTFRGLKPTSI